MARVALLCWELGQGLGHLASLSAVARSLRTRGWTCVFAIPPSARSFGILPLGSDIRSAPKWRDSAPDGAVRTRSSASLVDMLADVGLRDSEQTYRHLVAWHLRFAEMMPDLIIADHAPGALLAARGRIASIALGTGFSVPPPTLDHFPLLHDLAPPRDSESDVLQSVNKALARLGSPEIDALPRVLNGDANCACTIPALDPYSDLRVDDPPGPLGASTLPAAKERSGILCYFQPGEDRTRLARLAEALQNFGPDITMLLPGGTRREAELFTAAGARVETKSVPMADSLSRSEFVVHAGGHGVACSALLSGIPQLILDYDIEKQLNGRAVEAAVAGRRLPFDATQATVIADALRTMSSDASLRDSALRVAAENARYQHSNASARVADLAEELVPD